MESNSFRGSVLANLQTLSPAELETRSAQIIQNFLSLNLDLKGKRIGLYRSLSREVQLRALEEKLLTIGSKLCYPRILDSKAALMQFVEVDDPHHPESWEAGPYGGREPKATYPQISADELDLVICPGLAFGRSGERIGRGKGYYDRYLAQNGRSLRLALAFDFQLFPSLPQNPWDEAVDQILTESDRVIIRENR